jgi:hypothetical protein
MEEAPPGQAPGLEPHDEDGRIVWREPAAGSPPGSPGASSRGVGSPDSPLGSPAARSLTVRACVRRRARRWLCAWLCRRAP